MLNQFTETSRLEKPYPCRPFPVAPDLLITPKVLAILVVFSPLSLLLTVKWIRHLETLSKPSMAAIFLFYFADVVATAIELPIIANCLNMAFGSRHQTGQLFILGAFQVCMLYFPAALLIAVLHFSLRGYAYAAWLSTFDEAWTEKDRYALWWKLISFELWLSSFGDSAESIEGKAESQLGFLEDWIKLRISNLVLTWKQRIELELVEQEKKKKAMEDIEFDDTVVSKLLK